MSKVLVYNVSFSLVNTLGKETSGPYSTAISIDDGPPGVTDQMTNSIADSIAQTISLNLTNIFAILNPGGSAAPGGTVRINKYGLSDSPVAWRSVLF